MSKRSIKIEAGGKAYSIKFTTWAQMEFEQAANVPFLSVFGLPEGELPFAGHIVKLLWAGVRQDTPKFTMQKASQIIDEIGLIFVFGKLAEAAQIAMPELTEDETDDKSGASDDEESVGNGS